MRGAPDRLTELLRPVIEQMGYELVGVEYLVGSGGLLRVYIDQDTGINVDDCVAVSHQVSGVLDVDAQLQDSYQLEVSSPGVDRPLFVKEHFERYAGSRVRIKLLMKLHGRRRFEGVLKGVQDRDVLLDMDGETEHLPLDQIESARLIPEF